MSLGARNVVPGYFCVALFSVVLECAGVSLSFSNTTVITINDSGSPPTQATPYPSTLTVTGLTGQVVTKATVRLEGLTHAFPSDITLLLVGPQGQKAIILSEVGGQSQHSVTNITLVLDDDAASPLTVYGTLTSGTFKPTNGYLTLGHSSLPYDLPPPAPSGNSNAVSALSVFKNTDPSGTWNLFAVDDAGENSGSISGGWSLTLSVAVPLRIDRAGANVIISWPSSGGISNLQAAATLVNPNAWGLIGPAPALISGRYYVTNVIQSGPVFYRFVKP